MSALEFTSEELAAEEWRNVIGYKDSYQVSNLGRVRSLMPSRRLPEGGLLRPWISSGYKTITLCGHGIRDKQRIHVLVAAAFIGACPIGQEVNHIDGVKLNCRSENLEYRTHPGNLQHAAEKGLSCRRITNEQVAAIREAAGPSPVFGIISLLARKYGVSHTTISAIVLRKRRQHVA